MVPMEKLRSSLSAVVITWQKAMEDLAAPSPDLSRVGGAGW